MLSALEPASSVAVVAALLVLLLIAAIPWIGIAAAALVVALWLMSYGASNATKTMNADATTMTVSAAAGEDKAGGTVTMPDGTFADVEAAGALSTRPPASPRSPFARPPVADSVAVQTAGGGDNAPVFPPVPDGCPDDVAELDLEARAPEPANTVLGGEVLAEEPFAHPGLVDRMCEQQWFPNGPKSENDIQRDLFALHRAVRRDEDNAGAETNAMKAKRERARRRREADIASALRPDPYSIVEGLPGDAEPGRPISSQPFASLGVDHNLSHTHPFRRYALGMGDLSANLTSTY